MVGLSMIAVLAGLALVILAYSFAYTAWIEARVPPIGSFVQTSGGKVHVIERGLSDADAPVMVFIHGASGSGREGLITLAPGLEDKGRILLPDRPGLGWSERPDTGWQLGVQAAMLAEALRASGVQRAVIVGHSFGGAVSLRLALDHPDLVASLVLLAPASHPFPAGVATYNVLGAHPVIGPAFVHLVPIVGPMMARNGIRTVFAPNPVMPGYAEKLGLGLTFRPGNFRNNARDIAAAAAEFGEQAKRYPNLRMPISILSGSKDHVLWPSIHAAGIRRDVPHTELIILPETGHMPHHTNLDLTLATIERHLLAALEGQAVHALAQDDLADPVDAR